MRGSPRDVVDVLGDVGSIPACAGEPTTRAGTTWRRRVYPRVCGGAEGWFSVGWIAWGLSPRVRGSPAFTCWPPACQGSIPACAGEPSRVYPRVAGEPHVRPIAAGLSRSDPRVCGGAESGEGSIPACAGEPAIPACAGEPQLQSRTTCGTIPACAGEPPGRELCILAGVYPRVCGGASVKYLTKVRLSSVFSCQ